MSNNFWGPGRETAIVMDKRAVDLRRYSTLFQGVTSWNTVVNQEDTYPHFFRACLHSRQKGQMAVFQDKREDSLVMQPLFTTAMLNVLENTFSLRSLRAQILQTWLSEASLERWGWESSEGVPKKQKSSWNVLQTSYGTHACYSHSLFCIHPHGPESCTATWTQLRGQGGWSLLTF